MTQLLLSHTLSRVRQSHSREYAVLAWSLNTAGATLLC
jgi:hypothetical protein